MLYGIQNRGAYVLRTRDGHIHYSCHILRSHQHHWQRSLLQDGYRHTLWKFSRDKSNLSASKARARGPQSQCLWPMGPESHCVGNGKDQKVWKPMEMMVREPRVMANGPPTSAHLMTQIFHSPKSRSKVGRATLSCFLILSGFPVVFPGFPLFFDKIQLTCDKHKIVANTIAHIFGKEIFFSTM